MSLPSTNDHELPLAPPTAIPLIVIEDCAADQLIGEEVVHLASGTLQLYPATSSPPPKLVGPESTTEKSSPFQDSSEVSSGRRSQTGEEWRTAIASSLTLRIGNAAFSLEPSLTTVFTHAENPRWYFFSLTLPPDPSLNSPSPPESSDAAVHTSTSTSTSSAAAGAIIGSGSYIRLALPEGVTVPGSTLEKGRDIFEDILIGGGYLSGDPILSAADEIGRSISNEASKAASTLRERTQPHISSADVSSILKSTQSSFSPSTHSFVEGRANPGQRRSSLTEWAAEKLANVSIVVGERVANMFGIHVPSEEEQLEAGVASPSPSKHVPAFGDQNKRDDRDAPAFVTGSATPSDGGVASESDATPITLPRPMDGTILFSTDSVKVIKMVDSTANDGVQDSQQPEAKEPVEDGPSDQKVETAASATNS